MESAFTGVMPCELICLPLTAQCTAAPREIVPAVRRPKEEGGFPGLYAGFGSTLVPPPPAPSLSSPWDLPSLLFSPCRCPCHCVA